MASVSRVSTDGPAAAGLIAPMLATPGPLPSGPGWSYEFKWDGVRAVSYVERHTVRVMSRNDLDVTTSYPHPRQSRQTGDE
jgi:bifunctional non-homologous end joining protein LigD